MVDDSKQLKIDEALLKKGALILRAINHKLRQQLLQLIHKKGRVAVTEMYVKLHLEQSVASQHLAILRKAGMVKTEREGKQIFYAVDYDKLNDVQNLVKEILK